VEQGAAAKQAADNKIAKYQELEKTQIFPQCHQDSGRAVQDFGSGSGRNPALFPNPAEFRLRQKSHRSQIVLPYLKSIFEMLNVRLFGYFLLTQYVLLTWRRMWLRAVYCLSAFLSCFYWFHDDSCCCICDHLDVFSIQQLLLR